MSYSKEADRIYPTLPEPVQYDEISNLTKLDIHAPSVPTYSPMNDTEKPQLPKSIALYRSTTGNTTHHNSVLPQQQPGSYKQGFTNQQPVLNYTQQAGTGYQQHSFGHQNSQNFAYQQHSFGHQNLQNFAYQQQNNASNQMSGQNVKDITVTVDITKK